MTNSKHNTIKSSQALTDLYESLDEERQRTLFEFAEFLLSRGGPVVKHIPEPEDMPRPEEESVVGAVKRLKGKYHMIESMSVFSEASSLMTDHMVKGRDAVEVIDKMEILFEKAYKKLLREFNDQGNSSDMKEGQG